MRCEGVAPPGDGMCVAGAELGHHVHQRHVEEEAGGAREHPGGEVVEVAEGEADQHAQEGEHRGQDVVEDCLLDCHTSLQQHREVSCAGLG